MSLSCWAPRYIKNGCHDVTSQYSYVGYQGTLRKVISTSLYKYKKVFLSISDPKHGLCSDNLKDDIVKNCQCQCCKAEQ